MNRSHDVRFTNAADDLHPNMFRACIDRSIPSKHMMRNRIL